MPSWKALSCTWSPKLMMPWKYQGRQVPSYPTNSEWFLTAAVAVAVALLLWGTARCAWADTAETECDTLAASPSDTGRPSNVPGVVLNHIDAERAVASCRQAVQENPSPRLTYQLGRALEASHNHAEALKYHRMAADQGHPDAQNYIGFLYANGQGVPQDYALATQWFRKAADQGNARAQVNLAFAYDTGTGVEQNRTKARELLHEAAEGGDEPAKRLEQQLLANDQSAAQRSSSSANDDGWKYLLGAVGAAVLLDAVVGGSSSDSTGSDSSDEDSTYDYESDREWQATHYGRDLGGTPCTYMHSGCSITGE